MKISRRFESLWHRSGCIAALLVMLPAVFAPLAHATENLTLDSQAYATGQVETLQAFNSITTVNPITVANGASITFHAGAKIVLAPGFTAQAGCSFAAQIITIDGDANNDGIPDTWEIYNLGGLSQPPLASFAGSDWTTYAIWNYMQYDLGLIPISTGTLGNGLPADWAALGQGDASNPAAVGLTTGQLTVEKSGAATYSIPLFVCPGTAGMEPKLALNYSSQGGAGILGFGWSLSGLSAISRGPQTRATDGQIHGVDFTAADRFYLDGQRLIALNGGADGADGTEYRTEMDSFSRIISYGASGSGPAYFKVWTKAGLIIEFGHTTDSAFTPPGAGGVMNWSVDKITDTVGNYMIFSYANTLTNSVDQGTNAGEQYLQEIDYTGNAAAGVAPYNSVKFIYESRGDVSVGYSHGAKIASTQRLQSIQAFCGATLAHEYAFDYIAKPCTNRSLLTDIREIGADGNAYPPLTFTYQDQDQTAPGGGWQQLGSQWTLPVVLSWDNQSARGSGFVDLNGDGRPDIVQAHGWADGNGNKYEESSAWLNTPNGWVEADQYKLPLELAYDGQVDTLTRFVDLNGDGLADIANVNSAYLQSPAGWRLSGRWSVPLGTQPSMGFYPEQSPATGIPTGGVPAAVIAQYYPLDSTKYLTSDNQPIPYSKITSVWITVGTENYIDLNGDGLPDLICTNCTIYYSWPNPDWGNGSQLRGGEAQPEYNVVSSTPINLAWLNLGPGTGLATDDNPGAGWQFAPQYAPTFSGNSCWFRFDQGTQFMDLNGDGLPDMIQSWYGGGITVQDVAINTGNGWQYVSDNPALANFVPSNILLNTGTDGSMNAPYGTEAADLNGDGLADLVQNNNGSGTNFHNFAYLNTGSIATGWIPAPSQYYSPLAFDANNNSNGAAVTDVNGDGIPDIIRNANDGSQTQVYLGTGTGWVQPTNVSTLAPPVALADASVLYQGVDFVDLEGRGVMDLVQRRTPNGATNYGYAWHNLANPTADRLIKVTTGLGVSAAISYKPLTDPTVYTKGTGAVYPQADVIGAMYVVSEVNNDDGLGGEIATDYTYGQFRSDALHGSAGFGWMQAMDKRTNISTRTEFNQTYPFIGMPDISVVTDGNGNVLSTSTSTWQDKSVTYTAADGSTQLTVHFPHAYTMESQSWELDNGTNGQPFVSGTLTTTDNSAFDAYGNALSIDVQSINSDGTPNGYEKVTTSTYDNIVSLRNVSPVVWLLGRLRTSTVTASAPGTAAITRKSAFTYDSTSGLLLTETVEPDDTSTTDPIKLTTTCGYDVFGNKTSLTVAGAGLGATGRTTSTVYDLRGQFPVSTTNALNQTESYTYLVPWGVMSSQTGPNHLTTSWNYDGMGRKIEEIRPDSTKTEISYRWAGSGAPAGTVYLIETDSVVGTAPNFTPYAPPTLAFYDAMGRNIYSFGINGGCLNGALKIVGSRTDYDAQGRAYCTSLPFYYGRTPMVAACTTAYDVLNRPLQTLTADDDLAGTPVTMDSVRQSGNAAFTGGCYASTTFEYDGLVTKSTNPKSQVTQTTKNSQGQIVAVVTNATTANPSERGETDYTYDAYGAVLGTSVINSGGSPAVTSFVYDLAGRKIGMADPDMGTWTYLYDAAGELISQTDAKHQTVTMTYDGIGRLVTRSEVEGVTTWTYDTAANGIGKLATVSAPAGYTESYTYDSLGRASTTSRTITLNGSAQTFTAGQAYDAYGRPTVVTYPDGYQVQNVYNAFGFLKEVSQASATGHLVDDTNQNQIFWQADSYSVWGGVDGATYGNGVTQDTVFSPVTGRIETFQVGIATNHSVAFYTYDHDVLGNLIVRNDATTGRNETYAYDGLNRLTSAALTVSGGLALGVNKTQTVGYDSLGNITSKSDVGAYTYGQYGAGPHAVTSAGGSLYTYDADGNIVSGGGRSFTWTSFNQVATITQGAHHTAFTFDADHQRASQTNGNGTVTYYVGSLFEQVQNAGETELKHYIFSPAGRVAVRTTRSNGTVETRYLHQDSLGSIIAVTSETGDVMERYAYDAWGVRTVLTGGTASVTRGFTDHEMLDEFNLIHMNGRIFDPVLGRFLSADPNIQTPSDSQSYNRYSYLINNPLDGTDPTGFFKMGGILEIVAVVVLSIVTAGAALAAIMPGMSFMGAMASVVGCGATLSIGQAMFVGAVMGFTSGFATSLLNGGSIGDAFKSGLIGGIAGGLTGGIAARSGMWLLGKGICAGVVGGAAAEAEGGQFRSGFEVSCFCEIATPHFNNYYEQLAANAVVGGTASAIGGGKFTNGAISGAFHQVIASLIGGYCSTEETSDVNGSGPGTVPSSAVDASSSGYRGQPDDTGCVPTSAWNALRHLDETDATSPQTMKAYDACCQAAAKTSGQSIAQASEDFNIMAKDSLFIASVSTETDPYNMVETALKSGMPFLVNMPSDQANVGHEILCIPNADKTTATVVCSENILHIYLNSDKPSWTEHAVVSWQADKFDIGAGIVGAQGTGASTYSLVQIKFK